MFNDKSTLEVGATREAPSFRVVWTHPRVRGLTKMRARFLALVGVFILATMTRSLHAADNSTEIAKSYKEVFERLTEELLLKLEKSPVLLIRCFDGSESIKDDQKEIRDHLVRVYDALKLAGFKRDRLLSVVTSFGGQFHVQTHKPTSNTDRLRRAIDSIPIDNSGKEMMCSAIGRAVAGSRKLLRGEDRQMMLIAVTDESGDPTDNRTKLEPAIAEAKAAAAPSTFSVDRRRSVIRSDTFAGFIRKLGALTG